MLQSLFAGHPLGRIHVQKATHEAQGLLRQTAHVALFQSLWLAQIRKLKPIEPGILFEYLLLVVR